ncbi:MAG: hypothetical protein IPK97_01640 [Ahniella sp.]|nr:hypothetical protein [Ahniella sp.]
MFLKDNQSGQTILVSRQSGSPLTAANAQSVPSALSADGRFVLYFSQATNIIAGATDTNGPMEDVFLFDRDAGSTSLVSRMSGAPTTTSNGPSFAGDMSDDGRYVVFQSNGTNLVEDMLDTNGSLDVFLYDRVTQSLELISRSANNPGHTADAQSSIGSISNDGRAIVYNSYASDLVEGQVEAAIGLDVFLHHRKTGATRLVSRAFGNPVATANGDSFLAQGSRSALSSDGRYVLYTTSATNIVPGVVDDNASFDVYLFDSELGLSNLVSRSSGSPSVTPNGSSGGSELSADGRYVLFSSSATQVAGVTNDANGFSDTFLFDRMTEAAKLISRAEGQVTVTANGGSVPMGLSNDGQTVLYRTFATNVINDVADSMESPDLFVFDVSSDATRLVTRSAGNAASTANGDARAGVLSGDGLAVLFSSSASDLLPSGEDANGLIDQFRFDVVHGTVSAVSTGVANIAVTVNDSSYSASISPDGNSIIYSTSANNVIAGHFDPLTNDQFFLLNLQASSRSALTCSAVVPNQAANGPSFNETLSGDGNWLLYDSYATDLIQGGTGTDTNIIHVYLMNVADRTNILVSRSFIGPSNGANASSRGAALSHDGSRVLFNSEATDLVQGQIDAPATGDVFLYDRDSGTTTLLSNRSGNPLEACGSSIGSSIGYAISSDGDRALFATGCPEIGAGVLDDNGFADVFVADLSASSRVLVSHEAGNPNRTANGNSDGLKISATGGTVLFQSDATNLVSNSVDTNSTVDVFLHDLSSGASTLVSSAFDNPSVAANGSATAFDLSADGQRVLFQSQASNLVGDIDANSAADVFLFDRAGQTRLISRAWTGLSASGDGNSTPQDLSADGRWVLFNSEATNLVEGLVDSNGSESDAFVWDAHDGSISPISLAAGPGSVTANKASFGTRIHDSGNHVLVVTEATNFMAGVADGNAEYDVYVASRAFVLFQDGFE